MRRGGAQSAGCPKPTLVVRPTPGAGAPRFCGTIVRRFVTAFRYIARQLYDLQTGARNGAWSDLMDATVANLTIEDIVNIAAYTASIEP